MNRKNNGLRKGRSGQKPIDVTAVSSDDWPETIAFAEPSYIERKLSQLGVLDEIHELIESVELNHQLLYSIERPTKEEAEAAGVPSPYDKPAIQSFIAKHGHRALPLLMPFWLTGLALDPARIKAMARLNDSGLDFVLTPRQYVKLADKIVACANDQWTFFFNSKAMAINAQLNNNLLQGINLGFKFQIDDQLRLQKNSAGMPELAHDPEGFPIVDYVPLGMSPARKAGVRPGMTIRSVNDQSTKNLTIMELDALLRFSKNTEVVCRFGRQIQPGNEAIEFDVRLTVLAFIPTVTGSTMGDFGYIRIRHFQTIDVAVQVQNELKKLSSARGFVIDLRDNPGGLLRSAVQICSLFLDQANLGVLKARKYYGGIEEQPLTLDSTNVTSWMGERFPRLPNIVDRRPVVFLVNGGSASASEVLVKAIQEQPGYRDVTVVGTPTKAKGVGQDWYDFGDFACCYIVQFCWLSPLGDWLGDGGWTVKKPIKPDLLVKQKANVPFGTTEDRQLQVALLCLQEHRSINKKIE